MSAQASNKTVHAISFTPEQCCSSGLKDYMGRNVNERTSKRHRGSKVLVATNPREDSELSSSGGVPGFSPGFSPVEPSPNVGDCMLGLVFGVVLEVVPAPPAVLEIQMIYPVSHLKLHERLSRNKKETHQSKPSHQDYYNTYFSELV